MKGSGPAGGKRPKSRRPSAGNLTASIGLAILKTIRKRGDKMNANKMMKALAILCAAVLLVAAGMKLLPLAHAEEYNVGDAEISANFRNLEIDWTSGKVNIAYHSGNTVIISEKSTGVIGDDMRMRWRLNGDTLQIEYDQPGFHLFSIIPHKKELTVTLPQGFILEKASIHVTSADMDIPALSADSLKLESTSGDVRAAVNARIINGKLTSGDLELQVTNAAEEITIKSTSGDIRAMVKRAGEFKINSTSGDIQAVVGAVGKAKIESTSGDVMMKTGGMEALEIHTTSGSVTAYLPQTPGFTANVKSTSGHFDYQLPLTKQGNAYIAGDGSGKVDIRTTSGNVTISAWDD